MKTSFEADLYLSQEEFNAIKPLLDLDKSFFTIKGLNHKGFLRLTFNDEDVWETYADLLNEEFDFPSIWNRY